jgi:hypothetical protein
MHYLDGAGLSPIVGLIVDGLLYWLRSRCSSKTRRHQLVGKSPAAPYVIDNVFNLTLVLPRSQFDDNDAPQLAGNYQATRGSVSGALTSGTGAFGAPR